MEITPLAFHCTGLAHAAVECSAHLALDAVHGQQLGRLGVERRHDKVDLVTHSKDNKQTKRQTKRQSVLLLLWP